MWTRRKPPGRSRRSSGYPRARKHAAVFTDIESEAEIRRYYSDHTWPCGYPNCESIYFIAEISPDGRITPCRDYQDYTAGTLYPVLLRYLERAGV